MRLEGIHHITAITGDAPGNVDFYTRVLGLRLVKKSVNQDDPTVYHLFYADEQGSAGLRPDVLRVPRRRSPAAPGRGMVHRIALARRPPRTRCRSGPSGWPARAWRSTARVGRPRCASPTPRASSTSWSSTRAATSR